MEADFENTKDLFAAVSVDSVDAKSKASPFDTMQPKSKDEFDQFVKLLTKKISSFDQHALYAYFVESLMRDLSVPLSVDDMKKLSSSLTGTLFIFNLD